MNKIEECIKILSDLGKTEMPNTGHSCYGLKHTIESITGTYLTEDEFIEAAKQAGFQVWNVQQASGSFNYTNVAEQSIRELQKKAKQADEAKRRRQNVLLAA
jgi:hypothetical protein